MNTLVQPYTLWRFDCGVLAMVYEIEDAVFGNPIVKVLFGDNNFGLVYMSEFYHATKIG
jgi:hypothetical protein